MEESSRRAVDELSILLWGKNSNEDVFRRWRQGFIFSSHEKSALLQFDGGPCSVIASVQAFIIKNLLFNDSHLDKDKLTEGEQRILLMMSMCDILKQAASNKQHYVIAHVNTHNISSLIATTANIANNNRNNNVNESDNKCDISCTTDAKTNAENVAGDSAMDNVEHSVAMDTTIEPTTSDSTTTTQPPKPHVSASPADKDTKNNDATTNTHDNDTSSNNNNNRNYHSIACNNDGGQRSLSMQDFHRLISTQTYHGDESLQGALEEHLDPSSPLACLLFLYSVFFTKGLESLMEEMSEAGEPLIDPVHGHGTQSLTNLLLTGQAVSHIWDNVKELSGLKLTGISSQSQIGFLTLLEHLRYIEVGWYLKSPKYPIWLLASETHLTVFFSQDMALLEDNNAYAKRIFNKYDKEGRGFIGSEQLISVLDDLNLFSDPQYVELMLTRLDPEQLGIVTLEAFLAEFFPETSKTRRATVYHYNGLCRSCPQDKVRYMQGEMRLSDTPELQMMADDTSAIRTCLMTRWPAVEVVWLGGAVPSLN